MSASAFIGDSLKPVTADLKFLSTDYDFIPTYGIHLVAGRNFSRSFSGDTSNFILNESSVKAVGWKSNQEAIGKDFTYGNFKGKVIGVVGDFHFESLHQKIVPMVMANPATTATDSYFNRTLC